MMTQEYRGRGRPRPAETIERDARVLQLIIAHGGRMTRNDIADELELDPQLTWLSLSRLRKQGRLTRCIIAGKQTWCIPGRSGESR